MIRFLLRLVLIFTLSLYLGSQYYRGECIAKGGLSALITSHGVYCAMPEEAVHSYVPLRILTLPLIQPIHAPVIPGMRG